ncbi:MAG TPA: alpha/beta fold hydrolase [Sandaracinaceae bacterium LLY-WYZ-13_1]|nr:alpha/beta fold hydrolase [Sandaracinaceae bacterium LLY-WYZ-13_1]
MRGATVTATDAWPPPGARRVVPVGRDGVRWHVVVVGHGPALLALHGTGASGHSFLGLLPRLAPHFTVVVPDLPGHASTRVPRRFEPSLPRVAAATGRLLEALDLSPAVLVGHSAGAAVAAQMTLDGAVRPRLLVGVAAALEPLSGPSRLLLPASARWLARLPASHLVARRLSERAAIERVIGHMGSRLDPEGVERYRRLAARPSHVRGVTAMLAAWDLDPLHARLPSLDVHALLLAGSRDPASSPRRQRAVAARMRRARVVTVPGAGHLLHEERPELVARVIGAELDRLSAPRVDDA